MVAVHSERPEYRVSLALRDYAWDYLTDPNTEPVDVDPQRDLGVHPDDLPPGWDLPWHRHTFATGDRTAAGRARDALLTGQRHLEHALIVSGFSVDEAVRFRPASVAFRKLDSALASMWDYRRFGIPIHVATHWYEQEFEAPVARVYLDAGLRSRTAAALERFAEEATIGFEPFNIQYEQKARLILLCLDYDLSPERARLYVNAEVKHHEVPEWEARSEAGEDVDEALTALHGLLSARTGKQ